MGLRFEHEEGIKSEMYSRAGVSFRYSNRRWSQIVSDSLRSIEVKNHPFVGDAVLHGIDKVALFDFAKVFLLGGAGYSK